MPTKKSNPAKNRFQPRIRILCGEDIALGPGKVELLEHLEKTGSISLAAQSMGLSYMRAWTLIQTMNKCFKDPLVVSLRGGKEKGGAKLTATGLQALKMYRKMEADSFAATEASWEKLKELLRR